MTAPAYSVIPFLLSQVRTDTDALVGGSVYFYSPGTTEITGITIYLDKDGLQPANNPYTLDGDATAQLYASGSYRIVIKDVNGVTQFDRDNLYFSAGPDYVTQLAIGNYASLAEAVTAIGTDSARLLINEPITVAADLSVPANIILERIEPGTITVNPGVTLTIVSAPLSDATQWFYGTGTVAITGYPQDQAWWGNAQRTDVTTLRAISDSYIQTAPIFSYVGSFHNLSFTATVASKALTIDLKGTDGNNPSSLNTVKIGFRSSTITTPATVYRTITSATSVVLPSGGTLGFTAALAGRIYIWAIDNAGTVELAVSRTADIFQESNLVSTTAIGTGSDSATTMYSTSARTNVACRCIGYIDITTGGTAGEWDNAPTKLQVMGYGVKRTGDIVQTKWKSIAGHAAITTQLPYDDTIPQNTEGDEVLTLAITPTSSVNILEITSSVIALLSAGGGHDACSLALFQDTTAGALAATSSVIYESRPSQVSLFHKMLAGTTSATTFKIRAGTIILSADLYINAYDSTTRVFGGVATTNLKITEIMA
jgi:hypothetical protein